MSYGKTKLATATLVIGHIAGMIDLSALPLWIDALIAGYGYRPVVAGMFPTLFLLGAVLASILVARRFSIASARSIAPLGYWIAAACMFAVTLFPAVPARLVLHFVAGASIGTSLSMVHGTMGKSDNPHRTFAYAYVGFGVFSLAFLGLVPQLMGAYGPNAFFLAISGVIAFAALMTTFFMPKAAEAAPEAAKTTQKLSPAVRYAIAGFALMSLIQALVFSYLVQAGSAHGFAMGQIQLILVAMGAFNLLPGVIAAALEKRLKPMAVAKIAPIAQGLVAIALMSVAVIPVFGLAGMIFPAIQVFTHTFVFGFLAKNEPTGRATAATPAMIMIGSTIAPFLGGALLEMAGFQAIGVAAMLIGLIAALLFREADRRASKTA